MNKSEERQMNKQCLVCGEDMDRNATMTVVKMRIPDGSHTRDTRAYAHPSCWDELERERAKQQVSCRSRPSP